VHWHGTPDGRLRGIVDGADTVVMTSSPASNISYTSNTSEDEMGSGIGSKSESSAEETDDVSVVCEAKLSHLANEALLPQLVKTSVVSSFTDNCLHPNMNPMVPVILVNAQDSRICLYDARKDVLLISDVFKWFDRHTTTLCKPGVTLLWVMLNHR